MEKYTVEKYTVEKYTVEKYTVELATHCGEAGLTGQPGLLESPHILPTHQEQGVVSVCEELRLKSL